MRIFLLFSIFFTYSLFGSSAYLESNVEQKEYLVGEKIEAKLVLAPFTGLVSDIDIMKKTLFDSLYVIEVKEIRFSENNHEALEIIFNAIAKKPLANGSIHPFLFGGVYKVEIRSLGISGEIKEEKQFQIIESKLKKKVSLFQKIIYTTLVLLFFLLCFFLFKKTRKQYREKNKLHKFFDITSSFQHREDFERFYWDRELWINNLSFESDKWLDFSSKLNLKQYQKSWSEEDLECVRLSFERFRESVKKNGI